VAQFASTDELAARLGLTLTEDEETRAETLLGLASELIQSETGQTIELVEDDELTRNGSASPRLRLPERPVVEVSAVELDGDALLEGTDWYLDGDELVRTHGTISGPFGPFGFGWGGPEAELAITYSHGFDPIPGAVKAACLEVVVRVWTNPGAVSSESYGNEQVSYVRANGLILTEDERRTVREAIRKTAGSVQLR
jgi:hypothetical protein